MKLRAAFERAVATRAKSLALEAFGEHGEAELSKVRSGDRRPTFELLEAAFDADPEALFQYARERFGVKVEKPAQPIAAQLEMFGAELHSLSERISDALERAKAQERGMARVERAEPRRRRDGAR